MDALNYYHTDRSDAIAWWNNLSTEEKLWIAKKHYPDRNPFTLTGREIEYIFKTETHG